MKYISPLFSISHKKVKFFSVATIIFCGVFIVYSISSGLEKTVATSTKMTVKPALASKPKKPKPFHMVSLTFDDGTEEVYQNAIPILNAAHLKSTQYIITNYLDGHDPNFMDASQVQTLYHQGHEIASHTQSHQDLTSMSMERVDTELQGSKKDLENLGIPVVDFAYPGGLYNQPVEAAVQRAGYESGRKLENGLPLKGGNPMEMPAIIVTSDIPVTKILDLCVWAQNNGRWLVLVFHRVTPAPELDLTGKHLSITTGELKSIVNLLISHKMNVVTIQQGLATESKLLQ